MSRILTPEPCQRFLTSVNPARGIRSSRPRPHARQARRALCSPCLPARGRASVQPSEVGDQRQVVRRRQRPDLHLVDREVVGHEDPVGPVAPRPRRLGGGRAALVARGGDDVEPGRCSSGWRPRAGRARCSCRRRGRRAWSCPRRPAARSSARRTRPRGGSRPHAAAHRPRRRRPRGSCGADRRRQASPTTRGSRAARVRTTLPNWSSAEPWKYAV